MSSLSQTPTTTNPTPASQQKDTQPAIDPIRLQMFVQRLRGQQNLTNGIVAGLCAAIAGSIVWAIITAVTNYQIGWMAIGIGFVVGLATRKFGQGVDQSFGFAGAGLALFGCMLGNLLTVCIIVAHQFGVSYMEVIGSLDGAAILGIMTDTFQPMDILFYGIAIWAGYKYSLRPLTEAETQMLMKQA